MHGLHRFRDVQCSESTIWAVTEDGQVVVWEQVPAMMAEACDRPFRKGRVVHGLGKVRHMAVGSGHAAFITDEGGICCIGRNNLGQCALDPKLSEAATKVVTVPFPSYMLPAQHVACGKAHTTVVTALGTAFAWGDDSRIQLGCGDTRSKDGDNRPWSGGRGYIQFREAGVPMAPSSVSLEGGAKPFAKGIMQRGVYYAEHHPHLQWRPVAMQELPLEFERQVHGTPYPPPDGILCGDEFTALVVKDSPDWYAPEEETNRVFCCGENSQGQCGRSSQTQQQTFGAVKLPRCSKTEVVSCGSNHCMAILRRMETPFKREVWTWGSNARGQVGVAKTGCICPAARLRLPQNARAEAAFCGFDSSGVICSLKKRRGSSNGEAE